MTKTFNNVAAQGDVMFIRVDSLPDGMSLAKSENGNYIVTHSESGHHHVVMDHPDVRLYNDAMDLFRSFLVVENNPVDLVHLRSTDTHETIQFNPGIYEVRRQREYSPQGWQRAAD